MHEPGVGTWVASDTLVSSGTETVGFTRKWVVRDGVALAVSGSAAVLSLAHEQLEFDAQTKPTDLAKRLADMLPERGFKPEAPDGQTPYHGFSMLLATPERVLSIDSAGGVVHGFIGGFASRGSGSNYAEGAAWALARQGLRPREIMEGAIAAAMAHCRGCGGEMFLECLRGDR